MRTKASAVVACLALAVLSTHAQAPQAGGAPRTAPSRAGGPGPGTDAKKVIETMQDNLGMLRGMNRQDGVNRIELWGTQGTTIVGGRSVQLTAWRVGLNFTMQAMRFDYTHDGQRTIEVVSDKYAWNEETPGGKATAMMAELANRQLQLVLTPIGMAKAAKASGDAAKVTVAAGVTTLTFPANGATIVATLNKYMEPVKAEGRLGTTVLNVTYDQYGDWNDDAKADIYLPKHVVQTVNGMTVLDLTVTNTNTYNPYVIMPVPANLKTAAPTGARSN
jgi:hypothetical protein